MCPFLFFSKSSWPTHMDILTCEAPRVRAHRNAVLLICWSEGKMLIRRSEAGELNKLLLHHGAVGIKTPTPTELQFGVFLFWDFTPTHKLLSYLALTCYYLP